MNTIKKILFEKLKKNLFTCGSMMNAKSLIYAFICIVSTEQWVSIACTKRREF